MTKEFIATVENGKLPKDVAEEISRLLRRMEGKRVSITLKEHRRQRSVQQNRFYWGVVLPIACEMFEDAGNDADAETVHGYLKHYVGDMSTIIIDPSGKPSAVVGSSTSLTTTKWEEFIEKIRAWAAGFGVEIPFPHEDVIRQNRLAAASTLPPEGAMLIDQ